MKKIVVGLTGASGSIYSKRMIEELLKSGYFVHVIATEMGTRVFQYELGIDLNHFLDDIKKTYPNISLENNNNLFAGVASGSYRFEAMLILPCSMGTLAKISHGLGDTLLTRAADVCLKEKRRLVIVPRETPLNSIHLENMLKLSNLGVSIIPATPGFYHRPTSLDEVIDFIIGKILDHLSIENHLFEKWKEPVQEK